MKNFPVIPESFLFYGVMIIDTKKYLELMDFLQSAFVVPFMKYRDY